MRFFPNDSQTRFLHSPADAKDNAPTEELAQQADESTTMEVDGADAPTSSKRKKRPDRIVKRHRKAKNDIVFRSSKERRQMGRMGKKR